MSLLLLLTGYPQGGQGIPPEPEPEPEPSGAVSIGPGGGSRRLPKNFRVGDLIVDAYRTEEEEIFLIL